MAQEFDIDAMEEIWRDREGIVRDEFLCSDCGLVAERDVFEGEVSPCPGDGCDSVEVARVI